MTGKRHGNVLSKEGKRLEEQIGKCYACVQLLLRRAMGGLNTLTALNNERTVKVFEFRRTLLKAETRTAHPVVVISCLKSY